MIEHQQKIDRFKSDVLSLCMNSNRQLNKFKDYFFLLEESLHKFFSIEDCILFRVEGNHLNPLNKQVREALSDAELTLDLCKPYLNENNVIELPAFLQEITYFRNHTHMMPLTIDEKFEGLIIFRYQKLDICPYTELTEELVKEIFI